ncbi:CHAT domain-containing protein [Amycolatopsis jiangsuensis]|uniref:Tetratricopeptide (TPR) repeat protein n=1 Tax=Amycolatopsis jiangsuensis TaxID=1181879 RepID=A0A840J0A2_9PSEU|nr:CHAT domain-containing protein [Amycolatopsis jiangsuensis]MBB4686872.1 tetratricopeptide (TPR) repeat protein [Amycolatopsis jiangsuensis]
MDGVPVPPVLDPTSAANDFYTQGRAAAFDQRPGAAVRLFRRALARLDRASEAGAAQGAGPAPQAGPAPESGSAQDELRVRVLISLGAAAAEVTSTEVGLAHLETAERVLDGLPGNRELALLLTVQRAVVLMRGGQYTESLAVHDAVLPGIEAEFDDNRVALVRTLNNRALVHLSLNHLDAAQADLHRALELARRHGHARLEGKLRQNLGTHAQLVGDIPQALANYEQAARILVVESPGSLPLIRYDQARALLAAGLADEAARHLDEALPQLRANGSGQHIAEVQVARAAAALLEGDFDLARSCASEARRRFLRRGNHTWAEIAGLARLRADVHRILSTPDSRCPPRLPAALVAQAERLADLGLRDEVAVARMLAVRLLLRRAETEEAAEVLARVPRPRATTPVDHRMLFRLCRAELAVAEDRPRSALAQARAGLRELGTIRDRMGGLDLLCGTAVHGAELGRLAMRLVLRRARRNAAGARRMFAWLERTRAQVYRYEPLPVIEDPVLAKHIGEMRHVQRTIQRARLAGEPVRALESRYVALQREATRLGWYTSRWGRPRPVATPDEVVAALGDRVLLSLVSYNGQLYSLVVDRGTFRLLKLGPLDDIVETARQLHADLDALAPDQLPPMLAETVAASARRRADKLDALISAPLVKTLDDREIIIVPIGQLYAMPWGALPSLRGHPVSIAPSATAWITAQRPTGDGPVLLTGGPGVPGAVGEVSKLRSVYPDAQLVEGDDATSAAVLSALEGAGLAHLVAHGAHEPANALFSRVELVDGPLFAHETTRLVHPPERVVLAACELAMSHIRPGEEALGFAGTLLASGSRTVIGAVARVGDRAAADTMADLHRRLVDGTSPAQALADAVAVDPLRRPFVCLGAG